MTSSKYKFTGLILLAVALSGCIRHMSEPSPTPSEPARPIQPAPQPQPGIPVPPPPKLTSVDWDACVQPLVAQLWQVKGISPGSLLLVDRIKNSTNGVLQTARGTTALQNALTINGRFRLISGKQLSLARQRLGLSSEDSLSSPSKAIGLARYLNAEYVLYSRAQGDVKSPELHTQLMLVQTGEIIWSGKSDLQY